MNKKLSKQFLVNSEHTGRFIVISQRTGHKYFIERIGSPKTKFGDINPATKKVEGDYGDKYKGSIDEDESIIDEKDFNEIHHLKVGVSPLGYIQDIDSKYPSIIKD